MITFQVLTHLNIFETYKRAFELRDFFEAQNKKIGLNTYLITSDNYRAYIKVGKNGFDISLYQDDKVFVDKFIEYIEKVFENRHIAMHIDYGNNIKKLATSKKVDVSVL